MKLSARNQFQGTVTALPRSSDGRGVGQGG
jgi:molybdopterin-binding protein